MDLKGLNNAWLNPSGRIITTADGFYGDGSWHVDLGLCLLRDMWKLDHYLDAFEKLKSKFDHTASDELEDQGWLRLMGFGGMTPLWILPLGKKPTAKQSATIQDWCMANGRSYDTCFG